MQDQIGRYEIRRELGRGGMATVYLGYDPRFNRQVAIKVLPRQFTHDPRYLARFEQEAKTIATLEHPAIVPVYDFGEHEDAPYLVMRYMSGGSLRDRLNGEPLPLEDIASALEWLAPAVDYAHELDIVHRDLKPANILYDHEGRPYLADFGIARLAEASHTMTVVGTPAYMSPEQVEGSERQDGRADIYAMGVILYELLSGEQPYTAETPTKQMMAHVLQPVPDILQSNPDLPPEAQDVIEKVMAKDRDGRYATAGELATAVRGLTAPPSPPAVEESDPDVAAAQPPQTTPEPEVPIVVPVPLPQTAPEPEPPVDSLSPGEAIDDSAPHAEPDLAEEDAGDGEPAAPLPIAARGAGSEPPAEPPVSSGDAGGGVPKWVWLLGALALAAIAIFGIRAIIDGNGEDEGPTAEILPEEEEGPVEEVPVVEESEQEDGPVCTDNMGCVELAPGDPILLASLLAISGPDEQLGIDSQRGIELAMDFRGEVLGHAYAFDATNMILQAVEDVAQQGSDGSLLIGRQALRDALSATEGFSGITGTLSCDENGDCADPKIAVNQVYNGEFVPVWSTSGHK